ncbi:DUF2066 domain-containing protein [Alkalilimnicola ehrlichii MLHE-1]|uniref:DUF2066 domain-containing protein n=1 Tax=Alkalilimnicola ehrlichii (strain ATCC BAA-1101 / DSM 17681 / MLHE-1) TaxID=187272 RepID=Q0ABB6_ALKEH|nr:DUF2066 domain-containing protein [Alkalilimnicola ehrlichii]ABI55871.1 conserved hypothetical protein [Alkalilimnicola ehrlichii MLHE-1]
MRVLPLMMLLAVLAWAMPAGANPFYTVEVAVETRDEDDRATALAVALDRLLQRITGADEPAQARGLAELLDAPERLLAGYAYRGEAGDDLRLQARFDPEALRGALSDYTGAVWLGEGARLIVWAGEEVGASRELVGEGSDGALAEVVRAEATGAGLTPLLPLLDLEDRRGLSYSHVWAGFTDRIAEASERYGRHPALALGLRQRGDDDWEGRWVLLDGRTLAEDRARAESREALVAQAMQDAVRTLARQRGVSLGGDAEATLGIQVAIDSLGAYAAVLEYLEGLPEVREARLQGARGGDLALELDLAVPAERALGALEQSRRLSLEQRAGDGENGTPPRYRWVQ